MNRIAQFTSLLLMVASTQTFAQQMETTGSGPSAPTAAPFTPWGLNDGLYSPYSSMQNPPGSVQPSPLYSSPAGNPSGPQAGVADSNRDRDTRPLVDGNQTTATGREPSTVQPASRLPSAPADGGTVSGATSGSSSTSEADSIAPDGRKRK